jgi:hypothetical protein
VTDFVNVCGLYRRETNSGRVVHFGTWGKTRIYLVPNERSDEPAYWLAIRSEDYDINRHGPKVEVAR